MHPGWFRIGGVAEDLPRGWEAPVRDFLDYLPTRLDEYDRLVMENRIFKARTAGVGAWDTAEAVEWGVTGANLRACGLAWDLRKKRPYAATRTSSSTCRRAPPATATTAAPCAWKRCARACASSSSASTSMPDGPYKAEHPLATPPIKEPGTMHDIETLITHFLGVSWGPVVPPGEAMVHTEGSKGQYSYYAISDGCASPYRTRIRTPSFAHLQVLPTLARGHEIADLVTILGSIDFVMGDCDR